MTVKQLLKIPGAVWHHAVNKMKIFLENSSRRKRLVIIIIILALFALVDVYMIFRSFRGDFNLRLPRIDHVEVPIPIEPSKNP